MTTRERFLKTLNFNTEELDRLPMIEWAAWWDLTIERWAQEGLDTNKSYNEIVEDFGLDVMDMISCKPMDENCPKPGGHGMHIIQNEKDYERILPHLYTQNIIDNAVKLAKSLKKRHDNGEIVIRVWLDGFFWYPRELFGIEPHFYAFYDCPELMHRINNDLANFSIKILDAIYEVLIPDMVGFAEDMSYNHGPMLSKTLFEEFLKPYYQRVIPHIKKKNIKVLIDSDGDITSMIPWLIDAGIEGIYPLERQSHVDINFIREKYPEFVMMGGYDKMVMSKDEKAMRDEFERILPVMKSGGYIPSVDHQTPPGVSLENYKIYLRLFKEYADKAVSKG